MILNSKEQLFGKGEYLLRSSNKEKDEVVLVGEVNKEFEAFVAVYLVDSHEIIVIKDSLIEKKEV